MAPVPTRQLHERLIDLILFGVTLSLYGLTLAPTLSWRNGGTDGGDLITAATLGSVPHPSGYPTYILLARAWLFVSWGDEAWRMNGFSALCASTALALCYGWLRHIHSAPYSLITSLSNVSALCMFAVTPLLWALATITEVHTLHLLFIVVLCIALWQWQRQRRLRDAWFIGLLWGLGLGNHLTFALMLPSMLIIVATETGHSSIRRTGGSWLMGCSAGLLVYMYLPIASQLTAHPIWGRIDSITSLMAHVSGALYRDYVFALPLNEWPRRIVALLALLLNEFQGWGIVFAGIGCVTQYQGERRWAVALSCLALCSALFAIGYRTTDSFQYLLPAWFVITVWLAIGLRQAFTYAQAQWGWRGLGIGSSLIGIALLLAIGSRYTPIDVSRDHTTEQFAQQTLTELPHEAIVLTNTDQHTFALWYFTLVRRVRPDVVVIDQDLFDYAPYRAYLQTRLTPLNHSTTDSLETLIRTQWSQRPMFALDPPAWITKQYQLQALGRAQHIVGVKADAPNR
jgi:hypothetical protein